MITSIRGFLINFKQFYQIYILILYIVIEFVKMHFKPKNFYTQRFVYKHACRSKNESKLLMLLKSIFYKLVLSNARTKERYLCAANDSTVSTVGLCAIVPADGLHISVYWPGC